MISEEIRSALSVSEIVMENLPEYPGYNGSALVIDDTERDNVVRALSAAYDALHRVEAEKEPEWINCADRLPDEDDADFEGKVFAHCKDGYWLHTCHWETVRAHYKRENFTHWMPTGLRRPAPPEHKPE